MIDPNGEYFAVLVVSPIGGFVAALFPATGFDDYVRHLDVVAKVPVSLTPPPGSGDDRA